MKRIFIKCFLLVGFLEAILTIVFAQENIPQFLCDGVPIDEYVRNVTDCTAWIKCKAEKPISGYCPEPYLFDETKQICTTLSNLSEECYSCPDKTAFLASYARENSCNRYIRCLRGVATEQICDPGLQFSNETNQCELESDVGCTESEALQCPKKIQPGDFYAINDSANCSIGLVCVGDPQPISIVCSQNLHFNKNTLMCGNPGNSGCTEPTTTVVPTPSVGSTTTTTTTTINPDLPEIGQLLKN